MATEGKQRKEKMRKLIIAAVAVCAAACVQAGAYTWGLGSYNDEDSSGGYLTDADFTVIQLLGTVAETDNGNGTYALDFTGTSLLNSTSAANADYTIGSVEYNPSVTSDAVTQGTPQAFSILVLEQSGVSDYANYRGSYALITGTSSPDSDPNDGSVFMNLATTAAVTADMYKTAGPAQDVPEPTSGLLMLLGVAGLALRRKHA